MRNSIDAREFMTLSCKVDSLMKRVDELEDELMKNVMTATEASKYLGISRNQLYYLIKTYNLPFFKPYRKFMFERRNLDEWVRENSRTNDNLKFL